MKNQAEKKAAKLLALALSKPSDRVDSEIFEIVDWLIENDADEALENVIVHPGLSQDAADSVESFRHELGYRALWISGDRETTAIPFGIILEVTLGADVRLPAQLVRTHAALGSGLLRRLLGVGPNPSLVSIASLVHPENPIWLSPSRTRRLLERAWRGLVGTGKLPVITARGTPATQTEAGDMVVRIRVLTRIVFTGEPVAIEDALFGGDEVEPPTLDPAAVAELESIVCAELGAESVEVLPMALEFNEVPVEAVLLNETQRFAIELARAVHDLLDGEPGGVSVVVHSGVHEERDGTCEVRIAAYESGRRIFAFAIKPDIFDDDMAAEMVIDAAKHLCAVEIRSYDGVAPSRCDECGELLWPGPACH